MSLGIFVFRQIKLFHDVFLLLIYPVVKKLNIGSHGNAL